MTKEELLPLVEEGKSFREIARIKDISLTKVRYWAKKFGLKSKAYARNQPYYCKYCGETKAKNFVKMSHNRRNKSCCKKCHSKRAVERLRRNKKLAVEYKGSKCQRCGYDRCIGALVFHHRDPKQKDPDFNKMRCWNFEKVRKELDKCELLCSNCHAEVHNGTGL